MDTTATVNAIWRAFAEEHEYCPYLMFTLALCTKYICQVVVTKMPFDYGMA